MKAKVAILLGASVLAAVVGAGQDVRRVLLGERTLTTKTRTIKGEIWVPAADLARGLGYRVRMAEGNVVLSPQESPAGAAAITTPQEVVESRAQNRTIPDPLPGTFGQISNLGTPPRKMAELSGNVAEEVSYGDVAYTVLGFDYSGRHYRQQYDPEGRQLQTSFDKHQLVVIRMSVTNRTDEILLPPIPGQFDATVFDEERAGYPVSEVDVPRAGDVRPSGGLGAALSSKVGVVRLAPGGTMNFALLAGIPRDRRAAEFVFRLPASELEPATGGARVVIRVPAR
jgi:hypothetical protein